MCRAIAKRLFSGEELGTRRRRELNQVHEWAETLRDKFRHNLAQERLARLEEREAEFASTGKYPKPWYADGNPVDEAYLGEGNDFETPWRAYYHELDVWPREIGCDMPTWDIMEWSEEDRKRFEFEGVQAFEEDDDEIQSTE